MSIIPDYLDLKARLQGGIATTKGLFYGGREESIEVVLLNTAEEVLSKLDVVSGSLDFSIYDTIRSGGSLSVSSTDTISWLDKRIAVIYVATTTDRETGEVEEWRHQLGIFIPSSPRGTRSTRNEVRTLELYDKLLILAQDSVTETFEVPAGAVATTVVVNIIKSTGETHIAVTPSSETVKATMTFQAGTTKLQIVNKLLDAINYFSLEVDGNGWFRASPYIAPRNRPESPYSLVEGENSMFLEDFEDSQDDFAIPNKVVLVARVEGDKTPFTAFAENRDPKSPTSYQSRGNRWVTYIETDVEAASQAILDKLAVRRLESLSSVSRTYEVSHALLPYTLNEVVRFDNPTNNINNAMCTIQKMEVDLTPPSVGNNDTVVVKSTLREVVWLENA